MAAEQAGLPVDVAAPGGLAHRDDAAQSRAVAARGQQRLDCRLVDERQHRLAVVEPVGQRLGAEQHRQRHRHRAERTDGHLRHGGLEALRHHDGDAVAAGDAQRGQGGRQLQRAGVQVGIAELRHVAALMLADQCRGLRRLARPARATGFEQVEAARHPPAKTAVDGVVGIDRGLRRRAHRAPPKSARRAPLMRQMRQSGITVAPIFS